ncbi:transmembrane protein, putative [Medicago truncatula]|uniref:Transmembrane protein, putative n=1 Tax=Medicago truncatula TaxID=3880 RepID=A0A072V588_MEDTR|nr:transmembrane protein, putative [Medicago truncatula]
MKNMLALSITIVLVYTISSQLGIAFSRASIALGETEYLCDAFAADCIRLSDSAESRALYYSPDDSAESTAPYYSPDDSAKSPAPGISPSATYLESSDWTKHTVTHNLQGCNKSVIKKKQDMEKTFRSV